MSNLDFLAVMHTRDYVIKIVASRLGKLLTMWQTAQCQKITEKVAFNIASEASYIFILSEQKFIKNAKNGQFWRVFEMLKLSVKQCYQTGHF